jgi:hypothetical protein
VTDAVDPRRDGHQFVASLAWGTHASPNTRDATDSSRKRA